MPVYTDGRDQERHYGTFEDLDSILAILGSTRVVFLPFLTAVGAVVQSYGGSAHDFSPSDEAGDVNLEDEFIPYKHEGGVFSYFFDRSANNHLEGVDHADFSHVSAGDDLPFSIGAFVLPRLAGTKQTIFGKYDVAGAAREYALRLDASEKIEFELFDESIADANAAVTAPGDTALTINVWSSVIATYNGAGGNPGLGASSMTLVTYLNGIDDTGTVVGAGGDDYVDMEDLAGPPMIGAADDQAAPTFEFEGRIALPFITGKELSAAEVSEINAIGRRILGLA